MLISTAARSIREACIQAKALFNAMDAVSPIGAGYPLEIATALTEGGRPANCIRRCEDVSKPFKVVKEIYQDIHI